MRFRLGGPTIPSELAISSQAKTASTGNDIETGVKVEADNSTALSRPGSGSETEKASAEQLQHGVQAVEAAAQVWTQRDLIIIYVVIWIVNFIQAFSSGITSTLTPYVTSAFEEHSLTATTSILSGLIGGLVKLPYAKFMDIFGRPQGLCLMLTSVVMGLIMMAACKNVQTYCAAQVFYYVGYNGIDFTITIFIADTSKLKNRAWWIAYASSPYLITTWVYGPAVQRIIAENGIGFRWGFGIWTIVYPIVCFPLIFLLWSNQKKAEKQGLIVKQPSGRTFLQSLKFYLIEFDVVGLLLLSAGLALFLLSFSLYAKQANTWRSPLIICFLIFGGLLVAAFVLYERYVAPKTFVPWYLIKNRTVFFTFSMVASLYTAWYIWDNYFYSYMIAVWGLSVTNATYVSNIYTIGSCFWVLIMGAVIKWNGRLKWEAVFIGVPLTILGVGLMIHFRQPDINIGFIVMCQIFIAFGGGTLVICEQMTVMAVSKHQDIPAILATEAMIANIGGSIGSTIASAMWQGIFPKKLLQYLPADAQADFASIYGDLTVQASYPAGSPTKLAINRSYSETQRLMLIAATCLYSITWGSTLMWEDVDVRKIEQLKGYLF
ncbi:hypothetical protein BP6252_09063 [Coleophoma cylindrospora]|uniref:Uncharacterized protein n=1 Tax=Coleophoma cylindrospora TaxID=1849047 RepID=A0A3D8R0V2_9HELO|nr:hypothetical protein BP6252_09063 [Coleophoma cylindrospora]